MEIKGIGAYAPAVKPAGKPQVPDGQAGPAAQGAPGAARPAPAGDGPPRVRVQAKDLLSEEEQRYMETLFPGSTGSAGAPDTYAGKGRPGPATPGTLVDRKG